MNTKTIENINILALAFIGDCIYDLYVRESLVRGGPAKVRDLHNHAASLVNATAQARAWDRIQPLLTDEETAIFKRGRNAKTTPPRNASAVDYSAATGFEALIGALHIMGEKGRLDEIFSKII